MTWLNPQDATTQGNNLDTQVAWLRVAGGGELTPEQLGGVQTLFRRHKANLATSLIGYASVDYTLPDGTRLHVQSNSGIHQATVFPVRRPAGTRLPHGFCVVSNDAGVIYGENDGIWGVRTRDVPQAGKPILTDNYVIVADPETRPLLVPLVRQQQALWANRRYAAHDFGDDPPPVAAALFLTVEEGEDALPLPKPVHSLVDHRVHGTDGTALYTMADTDPILLEAEDIHHEAGATDTRGTLIVLQSWRRALIADIAQLEQFRLCNETVKRIGVDSYEQVERNVVDLIVGPTGNAAVTTTDSAGDTLNGDEPEAEDLDYIYVDTGSTTNYGDDRLITWEVQYITISGSVESEEISATFDQTAQGPGEGEVLSKILALPREEGVDYVAWHSRLNYPDSTYWRAGVHRKNAGYTGTPGSPIAYWQTDYCQIQRIDQRHNRDCAPRVWLDIPWVPDGELAIFEGTGEGRVNGGIKQDIRRETTNGGGMGFVNNDNNIWTTISPVAGEFHDVAPVARGAAANARFNELAAPHNPSSPTIDIVTRDEDEGMSASIEYHYTSRQVIDFDARSQFYAAIKVDVVCTGAQWEEATSLGFRGYLHQVEMPTYEVSIYFEWCWDGVVQQTLLAQASGERPGFEFQRLEHDNMFAWPFLVDPLVYYLPPVIAPPGNAAAQLAAVMGQQGTNLHYAGADVLADGADSASDRGIEYSTDDGKVLRSAPKWVPGMLYARTFTLGDLQQALWLLGATKCNAPEFDDPENEAWHYLPELGALIDAEVFHIELRNGELVTWSDDIPSADGEPLPAPADRDINIHRV